MKKYLEVKKSRNGQGIFVLKTFSKAEIIFEVKGKFISGNIEDEIEDKTRDNAFRFDKNKYLSPQGQMGDFLNHSCEPNARVVKMKNKLFIRSIKDIQKDEEVTIDYSTILASDDAWQMRCKCGTKSCRGVVKKFKTLPKGLKETYLSAKMVPRYILD